MFNTGCLKNHERPFLLNIRLVHSGTVCEHRSVLEVWTLWDRSSPPTGSLHAWPFQTVMLSHVIHRPAGNHLLKALLWLPIVKKKKNPTQHWLEWPSTGSDWFTAQRASPSHTHTNKHKHTHTHRKTDGYTYTHPQKLLLCDVSHEQSPQLALRGFRAETWSSGAKNNIRQVCCPAVAVLGSCGTEESRVCVLTGVLLLIRSPAMFSPTSGYYVMFVSVTP